MADQSNVDKIKELLADTSDSDKATIRDYLHLQLVGETDDTVGSADASADDEKRKYIAQHGDNPNAQTTAQAVPQPESDEVKKLQDEAAEAEHQAKGQPETDEEKAEVIDHAKSVADRQNEKLKDPVNS